MKHLWLGVTLIAAASGVLLFSDWAQRSNGGPLKRIALVQHASPGWLPLPGSRLPEGNVP